MCKLSLFGLKTILIFCFHLHCAGRRYLCSGIARPGFPSAEVIRGRFHLLPIPIKLAGFHLLIARCRCGSGRPGRPITPLVKMIGRNLRPITISVNRPSLYLFGRGRRYGRIAPTGPTSVILHLTYSTRAITIHLHNNYIGAATIFRAYCCRIKIARREIPKLTITERLRLPLRRCI